MATESLSIQWNVHVEKPELVPIYLEHAKTGIQKYQELAAKGECSYPTAHNLYWLVVCGFGKNPAMLAILGVTMEELEEFYHNECVRQAAFHLSACRIKKRELENWHHEWELARFVTRVGVSVEEIGTTMEEINYYEGAIAMQRPRNYK